MATTKKQVEVVDARLEEEEQRVATLLEQERQVQVEMLRKSRKLT
jgi:hypothetical protein